MMVVKLISSYYLPCQAILIIIYDDAVCFALYFASSLSAVKGLLAVNSADL